LAGGPVKVLYLAPRATRTAFNDERVQAHHRATATGSDLPERVAAALLAQLEQEAPERTLGFPERLAVRLNGAAPGWLDGAFRRHRDALPPLPAEASPSLPVAKTEVLS
jgi:short-subunit dehydrogenase